MALVLADRVKETTTTTGTGTVTLAGAATGFQSFAVVGNGNTTYYTIAGQGTAEWEVGIGTYTSVGTTLSRTTVLASSNSGSLVTFSAGTKDVFVTYPAGRSVYADGTTLTATNSSVLPATSGGTGQSSYAVGDLVYASTTTALSKLADVATGNAIISGGIGVAPSYGKIGLTTHISGTLALGNGGSGQTTAQAAMNAFAGAVTSGSYLRGNATNVVMSAIQAADVPTLNQNTTGSSASCTGNAATATKWATARTESLTGDITGSNASVDGSANWSIGTTLATVNSNVGSFVASSITVNAKGLVTAASTGAAPSVTVYTSSSGTYTTPTGARWLHVRMVGGGGGGAGGGPSTVQAGGAGGNTTFGTSLLTASGATGATTTGAGGTATISSPAVGVASTGNQGGGFLAFTSQFGTGGIGGASQFGGCGSVGANAGGSAAAANSGAGGGGGGFGNVASLYYSGAGGGAGGYIDAIITSPSATYSYAVGAGGTAGASNASGFAGGAGGSGVIYITAYF